MPRSNSTEDKYVVGAFLQACKVMESFRSPTEVLRLKDIVGRTGLPKGTVFRLLYTLHRKGFVEKTTLNEYRLRITLPKASKFRLGCAMNGQETTFRRMVFDSLVLAAQKEGAELIIFENKDPESALRNADSLAGERVDVAIEYQGDPSSAEALSAKCLDAGIPLIAVDAPHPGASYFGADNYQAGVIGGKGMGRWARQHWRGCDVDVVLVGSTSAGPILQSRIKGMLAGFNQTWKGGRDYRVFQLDTGGDFSSSHEALRKHLQRIAPRQTLVGATNDPAALAAIQAFKDAKLTNLCAVMGCNAEPEARAEMRTPETRLIGSVAFFPESYGEGILSLAMKLLKGASPPPVVLTKHTLVTPSNVDRIYPNDQQQ